MEIIGLIVLSFIAAMVGTITSFGTATVMVPILTLFYPFPAVLLFTGAIHAVGNIGKMAFFKSGIRWRLIVLFGTPGILFSYIGTLLLPALPTIIMRRILGVFIFTYVVYIIKNPRWKLPKKDKTAIVGGSLTGLSAAVFGVQGALRALFLSAFDLKKDVFLFTAGAVGIVIDVTRLGGYLHNGFTLPAPLLTTLVVSVPAALLGSYAGKRLVDHIPQKSFRTIIAFALIAIAVKYIVWA